MAKTKGRLRLARRAALAIVAIAALGSCPASAHQLRLYEWSGKTFTGSDSTAGPFSAQLGPISIDQATGRLYVIDEALSTDKTIAHDWVSQFDAAGKAVPFPGLGGASSIDTGAAFLPSGTGLPDFDVAFDNSPRHAGLYVLGSQDGALRAYSSAGLPRPDFPVSTNGGEALAVDPAGFPRVDGDRYDPVSGQFVDNGGIPVLGDVDALAFDSAGNAYVSRAGFFTGLGPGVYKYDAKGNFLLQLAHGSITALAVDPSDDHVFALEGGRVTEYAPQGTPIASFANGASGGFHGIGPDVQGITVDGATHDVYLANHISGGVDPGRIEIFSPGPPITVPDVATAAAVPEPTEATLHGTVNADDGEELPGLETTDCRFEWGKTTAYSEGSVSCAEGKAFAGAADHPVSATVGGLSLGTTYHFRLAAKNGNGTYSYGADRSFQAQGPPSSPAAFVSDVNTDGARLNASIDPNGGDTSYRFEYASLPEFEANGFAGAESAPLLGAPAGGNLGIQDVSQVITGLEPDTAYVYRVVATNANASATSATHSFKTFPTNPTSDPCVNAHVRQQTEAALLLDCRAYELVSAANAGGYDVESDLAAGQAPLPAYPAASDRLLYSLHFGVVPGIAGSPTNHGRDPYLAHRGAEGWSTEYVGLPADGMAQAGPFGSPLLAADPTLHVFAFGGAGICNPCFADGSTNIPLRQPGGAIVKGMAGAFEPVANPEGRIADPFSGDGTHFVFGSRQPFEPGAEEGVLSIYERDLVSGITRVVSTLPEGEPIGDEVSELALSSDGSRVLLGSRTAVDGAGNEYAHPYMHIDGVGSVDLTPNAGEGVLFDGMSADGHRVLLTSHEQLVEADSDHSADVYEANVDAAGALSLRLVSTDSEGEPRNDDSCRPPGTVDNAAWNSATATSTGPDCGALAFAGGAGVAPDGDLYFLSPERLDGERGVKNQPNLYYVKAGASPRFVSLVDSSLSRPAKPAASHPTVNAKFALGFGGATGVAVDAGGSVYVLDAKNNAVRKFKPSGEADNFTAGGNAGTNKLTGKDAPTGTFSEEAASPTQIAVDRDNGYLYVPDLKHNVVDRFTTAGTYLSQLSVSQPVAVAVAPSSGNVYVASGTGGVQVFTAAGAPVSGLPINATSLAVDRAGTIYATHEGAAKSYDALGSPTGQLVASGASGVAVDISGEYPYDGDVYVDEENQIAVFDSAGSPLTTFGGDVLTASTGLAVAANHHVYAPPIATRLAEFGFADPPYPEIEDPAVLHAIGQSASRDPADFQVAPDGRFAVFSTRLPLSGYENDAHSEIYRYDAEGDKLDCVSCIPSGAITSSDTSLSSYGLNLSDDGRVFFTSGEPLVLRDTNARKDAYEWEAGTVDLISTGASPADSGLLTVSADGRDAFFFTRQVLVPSDQNGGQMKIYDARAEGGFPFLPARLPCAASDECHGRGTAPPEPSPINTITGAGTRLAAPAKTTCRRGYQKRHGRCTKTTKKPKRHRHGTGGKRR